MNLSSGIKNERTQLEWQRVAEAINEVESESSTISSSVSLGVGEGKDQPFNRITMVF